MSFIGDIFGGGSKQIGTQTITQEPADYIKPYLDFGFSEAKDLYNTPMDYYPGQTFTDFSGTTLDALDAIENRARQGNPLVGDASDFFGAAIGGNFLNPATDYFSNVSGGDFSGSTGYNMLLDTARGDFLNKENPYLDAALQPAIDRVQSQFARGGRLGSGANTAAITNALAPVYAQNFENERARQIAAQTALGGVQDRAASALGNLAQTDFANRFKAAQLAPTMAAQDYADLAQLLNVGSAYDKKANEALMSDIARFNFFQSEPQDRLANFMSMIKGGQVGTQKSFPIYGNPLGETIGNIGDFVQVASRLNDFFKAI